MGSALGAFFVCLALSFPASLAFAEHNCRPFGPTEAVEIAKVVDGDTVHLKDGRKIRLIGINTPEIGYDGNPDQAYSQQARQQLRTFVSNGARLLYDKDRKDRYGRHLAHLFNDSGQSAEAWLLGKGLGYHVAIPANLTLAECLADAERIARRNKTGVWSSGGALPVQANNVTNGGYQRVQGTITKISFGTKGWWIVLDDHVAVVIYPKHQHRFTRQKLEQLKGEQIEVQGWVYPSRSKKYQPWRIKLETPYGLENLSP